MTLGWEVSQTGTVLEQMWGCPSRPTAVPVLGDINVA